LVDNQTFRFFDVELSLTGESDSVLAALHRSFGAFHCAEPDQNVRRLEAELIFEDVLPGAFSVHFDDGSVWRLPPLRPDELAGLLVRHSLAQVCSHFLLHAGALGWRDRAVLLVGNSGAGKTTLTLALEERGFTFLSDETGALARADGVVHPFPRPPRVQDGIEAKAAPDRLPGWMPPVGHPFPLGHLFFLGDRAKLATETKQIVVLCDRLDPSLLPTLQSTFGLRDLHATVCQGLPAFAYSPLAGLPDFSKIENLCFSRGSQVLDVVKSTPASTFGERPRCQPIPTSEATLHALGHLQNGYRSRLFRTVYAGKPAALYTGLASTLGRVQCHWLQPGHLEETVNLICAAID